MANIQHSFSIRWVISNFLPKFFIYCANTWNVCQGSENAFGIPLLTLKVMRLFWLSHVRFFCSKSTFRNERIYCEHYFLNWRDSVLNKSISPRKFSVLWITSGKSLTHIWIILYFNYYRRKNFDWSAKVSNIVPVVLHKFYFHRELSCFFN